LRKSLTVGIGAIVGALALMVGGLLLNQPPWFEPPGPLARLSVYLSTNRATTSDAAAFPELRPRRYKVTPDLMLLRIEKAVRALGWEIRSFNLEARTIEAVVTTPLLRFKDDVSIEVQSGGESVTVQVVAQSRIGKGDLGANARHVGDLYRTLDLTTP
jgi:uncharacterized protein (DUF1499 family)